MGGEKLLNLIGQLYDSATERTGPAQLSPAMAPYFGSESSIIHTCTQSSLEMREILSATNNLGPWAWSAYAEHYHERNVWFNRGIRKGPSVVVICEELVPNSELLRSEWYDYCEKLDWFHCLGIGVSIDDDLVGGIGFHRPRPAKPFDDEDRRKAQFILPHLERVLQLHHRIARLTQERDVAHELMDDFAIGILVLASDCQILFANRIAERALGNADGLSVSQRRLRIDDRSQSSHVERLIGESARTSAGKGAHAGGIVPVATPSGRRLFLLVSPFRSKLMGLGPAQPAAVVIFSDPAATGAPNAEMLRKAFGLTLAEARLAAALIGGQSLGEYADSAGITINTAKTQMRQVFHKTGHNRQIDLVRGVLAQPVLTLRR
jgi:DNA-binding CsgD family transcriptional regulator